MMWTKELIRSIRISLFGGGVAFLLLALLLRPTYWILYLVVGLICLLISISHLEMWNAVYCPKCGSNLIKTQDVDNIIDSYNCSNEDCEWNIEEKPYKHKTNNKINKKEVQQGNGYTN